MTKTELINRLEALAKSKKSSIENLEELLLLAKEADCHLQKPKAKEAIKMQQNLDDIHEKLALLRLQHQVQALKETR